MSHEPFPRIENPCSKKWDSLEGNGYKRFCGDCQLHVHNLSAMPARERSDFLQNAGHQCIAYLESPIFRKLDSWQWTLFQRYRFLRPVGLLVALVAEDVSEPRSLRDLRLYPTPKTRHHRNPVKGIRNPLPKNKRQATPL